MKKTLLICAAILALGATSAFAAGVNLAWDDCGTNGVSNHNGSATLNFACNSNSKGEESVKT